MKISIITTHFVIKPQALIKQWNQDLKLSQISNLDESTPKISNPYSNMTYIVKIHNVSYAIYHLITCNHMILKKKNNVAFIDETNIYSPLHIKNIIKEKYKLNNFKAISLQIQQIINYYNM
jgi:hypothetical protein